MAYGGNPGGNTRDAVRLLVGDTSTSTGAEYLSNTDYDFFLAQTPNIYIAAQLACNSLAAMFMGQTAGSGGYTSKSVGDLSITRAQASEMATSYQALAKKFGRMSALKTAPSAGGIAKPSGALKTPFFKRNLMDNPDSGQPLLTLEQTVIRST